MHDNEYDWSGDSLNLSNLAILIRLDQGLRWRASTTTEYDNTSDKDKTTTTSP